jgi:hypothetical protein
MNIPTIKMDAKESKKLVGLMYHSKTNLGINLEAP